jgi:hypothetical protein
LLVVANESSSSNGVHCNGVRMFHDNPALLQPPHERERDYNALANQQV